MLRLERERGWGLAKSSALISDVDLAREKTVLVDGDLVGQVSCVIQPGEGESPTEVLPELQELSHSTMDSSLEIFARFIDARQKAGHPVTLIHY